MGISSELDKIYFSIFRLVKMSDRDEECEHCSTEEAVWYIQNLSKRGKLQGKRCCLNCIMFKGVCVNDASDGVDPAHRKLHRISPLAEHLVSSTIRDSALPYGAVWCVGCCRAMRNFGMVPEAGPWHELNEQPIYAYRTFYRVPLAPPLRSETRWGVWFVKQLGVWGALLACLVAANQLVK